ncbi:penicillin-binding protein 1A [Parasulfuritortus cantonensis]|uniref:Penicillin-binding protein 1A n=1 Tax=Parasulfuritortus cantonensis TaxID=2528202 RepID=A0A4R1BIV6_9PROT|nr:penicillin-binding protein 1A [Parasulfuritortus cantonensis]TCJ17233.1 penicillin-binding protein 1A [Parasulfuritortus cantonensis]
MHKKWWYFALLTGAGLLVGAVALAGVAVAMIYPSLPSLDALTDYRPKMPLKVYSEDGGLLAEFGQERRSVVRLKDVPLVLRQAILAAEDERFYEHGGVDTQGVLRATVANLLSGGVKEGASTITMQVARNFFLSSERTMRRKLNEVLLAFKIEHALSKDEIFELYLNQIYLGQRAYGFAAAAQTYYGKPIGQINLAEAAMLAGLPKAPSSYNPVVNPARAKARQQYVLNRMRELRYISAADLAKAKATHLVIRGSAQMYGAAASHIAEMARQYAYQRYGDQIYVSGMRIYTTIRMTEQRAAEDAVRAGVVDFNRRRGYPGPEAQVAQTGDADALARSEADALARDEVNGMLPAIVTEIGKKQIRVRLRSGDVVSLGESEVKFARNALAAKTAAKRLRVGSLVRVVQLGAGQPWQLTYLPQVEAALVAISPDTGAIRALVGGFDFARNQFNHVTQAWRQPGSSFKPFIYSAALERGITPATVFDDAPLEVDPAQTGDQLWEPKNYDGETDGPVTVRTGLIKSKNLVAIRVLQATGVEFAQAHALRFGFTPGRIPPYLTMALGAGEVTPLQLVAAYGVFANGGTLMRPYFLTKVTDKDGNVLESFTAQAGERVLEPRNAFVMTTLMQDVVRRGTAAAASSLGRTDLAGKTGTTNDHRDTWFAGYSPDRVAVTWMGYDQPRPLGPGETGSQAALPIWMRYMAAALRNVPVKTYVVPDGVVTVNVNPDTGVPDAFGQPEYFYQEFTPVAPLPFGIGVGGVNAP